MRKLKVRTNQADKLSAEIEKQAQRIDLLYQLLDALWFKHNRLMTHLDLGEISSEVQKERQSDDKRHKLDSY